MDDEPMHDHLDPDRKQNVPKQWAPTEVIRQWDNDGLTLHEIAIANAEYFATRDPDGTITVLGWEPTRSAVSKHLKRINARMRRGVYSDLLVWRLDAKHKNSRWRFSLRAESKRRKGEELTDAEQRYVDRLYDRLTGPRGEIDMVLCYDRARGFHFVDISSADNDIIRITDTSILRRRQDGNGNGAHIAG